MSDPRGIGEKKGKRREEKEEKEREAGHGEKERWGEQSEGLKC